MAATPYVPTTTKKVKSKKPKFPTGHWEEGEWVAHDEEATKIRKQLTNKAVKKSLSVYVTLRKAEGDTNPSAGQPSRAARGTSPSTENLTQPAVQGPNAPVPNTEVRRMAKDYVQKAGVSQYSIPAGYAPLQSEGLRKRVADQYESQPHNPTDPDVARSYAAFAHETKQQFEHAQANGMTFTPWGADSDPYKTSGEMKNDVLHNKHLGFYQGGDMPPDHPLAQIDPDHGLSYNDMFRAVHDLYGHAKEGYEFGPKGEYNAFREHRQMYSPVARKAMRSETHGQNNWVNFGKHLRDKEGNLIRRGEPGWIHPNDRPFAEQKAMIMPDWVEQSG